MVWKKMLKVAPIVSIMSLMLVGAVTAQNYTPTYSTDDAKEAFTDIIGGTVVGIADVADLIGSSVGFLVVVTVIGALLGALFLVFRRARIRT